MVSKVIASTLLAIGLASPPPVYEHAATARWMAQTLDYGVLSTISTRSDGSTPGDPFGNPNSFAASPQGIPYFYVSMLDASMVDIFTADTANTRVSFSMSEAQLTGNASVAACEIGSSDFADPENPPCARLVLSGNFVTLEHGSDEEASAKAILFERHPSFKNFPSGHDFFAAKIDIDGIWLIDFYGNAVVVTPEQYLEASSNAYVQVAMKPQRAFESRPSFFRKIKTARWMVKSMNWGVLSTISTRSDGSTPGDAFGNPYAFADDSNGIPYIYASGLDASIVDLQSNGRMSLTLSEATLAGTRDEVKDCTIGKGFGDPENPPCARLVISGRFVQLEDGETETESARAALFDRHPSFANFPSDHSFFVAKLEIDGLWIIDMYGAAATMDVGKYLSFGSEDLVV